MAQMYFQFGSTSASMVWFHNGTDPTVSTGNQPDGTLETPGSWDVSYRLPKSEQVTPDNQMIFSTIAPETRFFSLRWTSIAPITEALANSLKNFYEGTAGGAKNKFTWQDQYGTQRVVHWLGDYSFSELPNDLYEGRITLFEEYTSTADTSAWTAPQPTANPFFQCLLYTGNGSAGHVITTTVAPGMVWINKRSGGTAIMVWDDRFDGNRYLNLNGAAPETSDATVVSSMIATTPAFRVGASVVANNNNSKYFAAIWYGAAGQSAGEFARAGFHIKNKGYAAFPTTPTHALMKTPTFMIFKSQQSLSEAWFVYHKSLGATKYLELDSSIAATVSTGVWNDTEPTFVDFTVGTTFTNGGNYTAMLWTDQAGYFNTGTWTGTAAAQSIDMGFKPAMVLIKRTDASSGWTLFSQAMTDNVYVTTMVSEVEDPYQLRIIDSGLYLYAGADRVNVTSATYIYAAWQGNG